MEFQNFSSLTRKQNTMNKLFLIFLIGSFALVGCNNLQTKESNNAKTTDTVINQMTDKVVATDIVRPSPQSESVAPTLLPTTTAKKENEISLIQPSESAASLSDIFKQLEKAPQSFSLASGKDTTLICIEGTKIKIKRKSFVSEKTGKEITGSIQVSVKEYYKLSDILLANLSTTSDDELLETGGMIHITASSSNENCILKKGQTIEISFPTKEKKDEMKLFTGNWENENHINWQVAETLKETSIFTIVEQMPVFKGGENEMMSFLSKNVKYPVAAKERGMQGKVFVSFVVNETGAISDAKVMRGVAPELDAEALYAIRKMPDWTPGKQNGRNVKVQYNLPINFVLDGSNNGTVDWEGKLIDIDSDSSIAKISAMNLTYYLLSSNQLGWINCDRYWKQNQAPINYIVSTEGSRNAFARIVFHRFKSVIDGIPQGKKISFQRTPLGEDITIVAIIYKDNKPFLCVKDTKVERAGEKDLTYQPLTAETLKSELKKLDRLN